MQHKHTQLRSYQKFIALCGAGLLSLSLAAAPVYAINPPAGDKATLPAPGATGGSGNSNTKPSQPSGGAGSQGSTSSGSTTGNKSESGSGSKPSSSQSAADKKKEEERKAAEKQNAANKKASTEAQNKVKQAGELSGVADKKASSDSLKIGGTAPQAVSAPAGTQTAQAVPQGAGVIGVGSGVADTAHKLGWGSNTEGFWFTSIWVPVGAGAAASLMIIGLATSAALRTKYKHEEELVAMDGMSHTGQYVAPLVPEMQNSRYDEEPAASSTDMFTTQARGFVSAPQDSQDTSAYLNALAHNDKQYTSAVSPEETTGYQASFENVDPGDTFIDRMRFKFSK